MNAEEARKISADVQNRKLARALEEHRDTLDLIDKRVSAMADTGARSCRTNVEDLPEIAREAITRQLVEEGKFAVSRDGINLVVTW